MSAHEQAHEIDTPLVEQDGDLLRQLTEILTEIQTTPSSGEISADLLGQLRFLMLQIEQLAADENNTEARQLKEESDAYLSLWFDDLVAQCEADGDVDWMASGDDDDGSYLSMELDSEDDDDEETIALALALQDEEDAVQEDADAADQPPFVDLAEAEDQQGADMRSQNGELLASAQG
ncbi:hypothetical protein DM01DRAFT_1334807 [Hesseltinella vesiculosa]|uniref:Uncharacterized protein n=1 Tax=Hesseltinella vesiculosa TaxID=101127 RepID=A0A1X2GL75_9FUNG|nr:hypothetical protein DM01DRAFT_1334807 [Hesseltinella vesiculosa]